MAEKIPAEALGPPFSVANLSRRLEEFLPGGLEAGATGRVGEVFGDSCMKVWYDILD